MARDAWRVWDAATDYGDLLFRRATGELPEMESAKATARILRDYVRAGDRVLDVGCAAGHYLRSLRREVVDRFEYQGVDATPLYIALARRAWPDGARFEQADVCALPFLDCAFDIVFCCNLLLHLPSLKAPLSELVRVARRHVLLRTLVGHRSFRIQEVRPSVPRGAEEFDDEGEPRCFNYYNIYGRGYLEELLDQMPRVRSYRMTPDLAFEPAAFSGDPAGLQASNATRVVEGRQVNGYILQPWHFVLIELDT